MNARATLETEKGSRYMAALCHHFGRKLETGLDGGSGWINFPFGRCELLATDSTLNLRVAAQTAPELGKLKGVVTSHLERFAFRENPQLEWIGAPQGDGPTDLDQ
ncbi:hypothetical protein shim_29750 [Shimia sp. SK013]|uniref:DUF2218 domain-containing protein n=1 Tax=Shimia sp. SK013 TaxID=1389006 RepID=UPI0006CCF8ED|nr:DUF2218 domain-containing protein [Shimia sp. SK013]KPA20728.1 hypothetical protein shim_29750 [Shimia sp. SK013]